MTLITDGFMQEMLGKSKAYTIAILKKGPNEDLPDRQQVQWEHVRRNFELREAGSLVVVCPVFDHPEIQGIGIFNADSKTLKKIMDEDPGVMKGMFTYEVMSTRSFPGDALPE